MTQDEIIEMAREAGFFVKDNDAYSPSVQEDHELTPYLVAFAHLVAAKATEEANARANASWTLMCKKMVAIEREALAQHDSVQAKPEPEQEPVAWADHGVVNWIADKQFKHAALLYEAPQRTWVGLTDEEIAQGCKESWVTEQAWQSAVWWAEAKLKQKNGYAEEKNT